MRVRAGLALVLVAAGPTPARAQTPAELIAAARGVAPSAPDSADALLQLALRLSTIRADSAVVWVWIGIAAFLRGRELLTRQSFGQALALEPALRISSLEEISPRLLDILADARLEAAGDSVIYPASQLDQPPRVLRGPPLEYPLDLWRRQVNGTVLVTAIIDTAGRAEPSSIEVIEASDSAFLAPARRMIEAYEFTPGRLAGRTVRTVVYLRIPLEPPPMYATPLVGRARAALDAGHVDSALIFTDMALDSAAHATEGDRAYALIVRGIAHRRAGHDSLAAADVAAGVALHRDLLRRGVDLAPVLRRLADSVSGRGRVTSRLGTPAVVGAAERIELLSYPPVRYPLEMRTLHVDGTVIVEATVDTTGRVHPASVRVVQSPNPGLNAEARRVVLGAVYRPIVRGGRKVSVTVRQPVTFELY